MNFFNALACGLIAMNCVRWATGDAPQFLFTSDNIRLWWLPAFVWTLIGIVNIVRIWRPSHD